MKKNFETLGDRLKSYEKEYERNIDTDKHIIVRIDGHHFSKYSKGFKKPFDEILSKAMEETTKGLVEEFQAVTGYTQSDEITLVIEKPLVKMDNYNRNHDYNGRVQKIASLCAGFATMIFNKQMISLINNSKRKDELEDKKGNAWFDARVYAVESDIEAFNSILWRIRDAEKNSRSMFCQAYCSHKSLEGKNGEEQVKYCLEKTGEDWNKIEDKYKYGILVKKEIYLKEVTADEKNSFIHDGFVERSRYISFSKHLKFSEENVEMIMEKALPLKMNS